MSKPPTLQDVEHLLMPAQRELATRPGRGRTASGIPITFPEGVTRDGVDPSRAAEYAKHRHAENTKRAYGNCWRAFLAWGLAVGESTLPASPETAGHYLAHMADTGFKASYIRLARVAIGKAHKKASFLNPMREEPAIGVWEGIRRKKGTAQEKKNPLLPTSIAAAYEGLPDNLRSDRDKALVMLGFAGGFRRSELVALNFEDLQFSDEGLIVRVARSKRDQEAKGAEKIICRGRKRSICPVLLVRRWLDGSGITEGPLFKPVDRRGRIVWKGRKGEPARLTDKSACEIVKRIAALAGFRPEEFGGHSLRSGFVTAAAENGARIEDIMAQTQHGNVQTVVGYMRKTRRFENSATKGLY